MATISGFIAEAGDIGRFDNARKVWGSGRETFFARCQSGKHFLRKILDNIGRKINLKKSINYSYKTRILELSLMVNIIYFMILQISAHVIAQLSSIKFIYAFINLGILFAFIGILYTCTSRLGISEKIVGGGILVYAIINIYVVEFHRTPLTIPELVNARTALNVLGGYSFFEIKPLILLFTVIILFLISVFLTSKLTRFENNLMVCQRQRKYLTNWHKKSFILVVSVLYIIGILHIDCFMDPIRGEWHFKEAVGKYGYPLYFLTSGLAYKLKMPSGYSEDSLMAISIDDYVECEENNVHVPDIILILNESFYDISLVTDIETDINYMGVFYNIDNSISGHVIVPGIGGGTNNSEYELLTANSTYLMQGITPFQTLDMKGATSIVTNLKELDYYTMAMHPDCPENYSRNIAYPNMGFDEIHFLDDFENIEYYGKRNRVTDKSLYENLIRWYENAIHNQKPIFSYLLTIQNHGEWNTNSPSDDLVHVINYDKRDEEKMNEYLSCVSLSINAFNELMEYFMQCDRQIILCMVGDHAPSFIEDISNNSDENDLLQRATPFIIWANFPIEEQKGITVSMNELGPVLLNTAGVELIPYYRFLLQLGEDVPILTSYGQYVDRTENIWSYEDDTEYSINIQTYFGLEYNNIQKECLNEWFRICEK